MTFLDALLDEAEPILRHLMQSVLLAIRYGLIALLVTLAAGKGCKTWPLIKQKPPAVQQVQEVLR